MKAETLNRIKTSVESTDLLLKQFGFDTLEFHDILTACDRNLGTVDHEISVDGYDIQKEHFEICAVINMSLFTYFYMTKDMENLKHLELFAGGILKTYSLLLEFEEYVNTREWWQDANEYGLVSYAQATKFYNSIEG